MSSTRSKLGFVVAVILLPIAMFYVVISGGIRGFLLQVWAPDFSTFEAKIDEFNLHEKGTSYALRTGPDGSMWVAGTSYANQKYEVKLLRVSPMGKVRKIQIQPPRSAPHFQGGIARGTDENAWFHLPTRAGAQIVQVNRRGAFRLFGLPEGSGGELIQGVDENLWFTKNGLGIGSISSSGHMETVNLLPEDPNLRVSQLARTSNGKILASGQDGLGNPLIVRVDRSDKAAAFVLPKNSLFGTVKDLAGSSNGNVWFSMETDPPRIGLMDPQGRFESLVVPSPPRGWINVGNIVAGPDGHLWFEEPWETTVNGFFGQEIRDVGMIGRLTPKGKFDRIVVPSFKHFSVGGIAAGTDGTIWYTYLNGVGRLRIPDG